MTENLPFKSLENLPLFVSDQELAVAIVGRKHATHWRQSVLPALERVGFPKVDTVHLGRAVPLVLKFYEAYLGIVAGVVMAPPGGQKKPWLAKRIQKKIDDEERRRAAGQDVPPGDYGNVTEEQRQAIEKYRADRAAFYRA